MTIKVRSTATRIGRQLSYANIVASLALVVAMSGTAYAVVTINGHDIRDHTIPASKLERNVVVPRASRADHATTAGTASRATAAGRVDHLLFTRGSKRPKRSAYGRTLTPDAVVGNPNTTVYLAKGQSATVFQSGPFTITARCVAVGDQTSLKLDGTSTESWYPDTGGDTSLTPAGDTVRMYEGGQSSVPYYSTPFNGIVGMEGVDGQALILRAFTFTLNMFSDCTFSGEATSD